MNSRLYFAEVGLTCNSKFYDDLQENQNCRVIQSHKDAWKFFASAFPDGPMNGGDLNVLEVNCHKAKKNY